MRIAQADTAIDAFRAHRDSGAGAQQRQRVLSFIRARGGDWSIGELASELRPEKSTVSARVNELLNETRELTAAPHRKDRISGITVRPVEIPRADGQRSATCNTRNGVRHA